MKLQGEVISGAGRMAAAMTDGPRAKFYAQALGSMVPGTLNLELPEPYLLTPEVTLRRPADNVEILVQRCKVENLDAFLVRSALTQSGAGRHPLTVVEVMAAYPMRRYLRLEDGSQVTLTVAQPVEPTSDVKGRQ